MDLYIVNIIDDFVEWILQSHQFSNFADVCVKDVDVAIIIIVTE